MIRRGASPSPEAWLWGTERYRLWSLLDVLRLFASEWNEVLRHLEALSSSFANMTTMTALVEGPKALVLDPLRNIERLCRHLRLSLSETYVARLIANIEQTPTLTERLDSQTIHPRQLAEWVTILRERIDDELRTVELFVVEFEKRAYLTDPYLFGPEVSSKFTPAIKDIEEAGQCFAFDRYTASVFHLMRIVEVGLRALGASLNDAELDPRKNPSWDRILGRCDRELAKPYDQRSPEWKSDQQFYANATANLRAVKDAWRNPTLHVERSYDEREASEIWNAVRAFMRHLATKL